MARGFWSGFAQGYQNERDRIEKRKLFQQEILEKRRDALVPMVAKRQQQEAEVRKAQNKVVGFFRSRLRDTDVPPEQQKAFMNIAAEDPERGLELMQYVERFENKHETRLAGEDLIKATKIFESTMPEGMEIDEWIQVAADISIVDEDGGFNSGATIERIYEAETVEELREVHASIIASDGSSTSGGGALGVDASFQTADMKEEEERKRSGSGSSGGVKYSEEESVVDRYTGQLASTATDIITRKREELEEILKDEELKQQASSEGPDAEKDPNSATYRINQANAQRQEMETAQNRIDAAAESGGSTLDRIPSDIRREAFDTLYETDEAFRTHVNTPAVSEAAGGAQRGTYYYRNWGYDPEKYKVEVPQVEVPEVDATQAPAYQAPKIEPAPIYEPGREILEDDTPNDGYSNPIQDKYRGL